MKIDKYIIENIAKELNIEPCAVYAIVNTESNGNFLKKDGGVPILYERHWVYHYVKKNRGFFYARDMAKIHPNLCHPKALDPKEYGTFNDQYLRLSAAMSLFGRETAYLSISMGAFQIMGFNHKLCGYKSAFEMYQAYNTYPVDEQVKGFMNFIKSYKDGKVLEALKVKDWDKVAHLYNGRNYKKNNYHNKLRVACMNYDA